VRGHAGRRGDASGAAGGAIHDSRDVDTDTLIDTARDSLISRKDPRSERLSAELGADEPPAWDAGSLEYRTNVTPGGLTLEARREAERVRAHRERVRRGLRSLAVDVCVDDLRTLAERGYGGAASTDHDRQAQNGHPDLRSA